MRFCSKTACDREAAAICGFDYAERMVWLAPLDEERHPACYDLCEEHAQGLRVPVGWEKEDRRPVDVAASPGWTPKAPPPPPSTGSGGDDRTERGSVPTPRLNRRLDRRPAAEASPSVAASTLPPATGSLPAQASLLI